MIPSIPLSISLAGLDAPALGSPIPVPAAPGASRAAEVRWLLPWARRAGFRAVQLCAATPGLRPRELDRSARRDLAASLRRDDLACSGLDLWIPEQHFADPQYLDRAVAAVLSAIELAADLATLAAGSVVTSRPARPGLVSLLLPSSLGADIRASLAQHARSRGVHLADHRWPVDESAPADPDDPLRIGLDPATILASGADPAAFAARLAKRVASARLTDLARGPLGLRVAPGSRQGRLDVLSYLIGLATASYSGFAVADLRGIADQSAAAATVLHAAGSPPSAG